MLPRTPPRFLALFAALLLVSGPAAAAKKVFPPQKPGANATPAPKTPPPPAPAAEAPAVSRAPAVADTTVPSFWRTRAERSGYRLTADYDETIRFCKQMEATSRWLRYTTFGTSGQGRELPLLIVSSDRAFTPEAARATGKAIVLIQNGIHAGEIEGKDASLALVRDLAVLNKRNDLLDHAILLVVPILSVDGHERHSRFNRINQNGPEEMGWRFSPIGLNLNRDYMKVETPEIRALISNVFTRWWPHLMVDNHTTDGADYRYDITYAFNHGAGVDAPLERWMHDAFEGRVVPRTTALGHLVSPYIDFRVSGDPLSGIVNGNLPPRFSNGYATLRHRAGLLVETHMLKPYAVRVRATYDLMIALLEEIHARPAELTGAAAASEAATLARLRATDRAQRTAVLATDTTGVAATIPYLGVVARTEKSDITGGPVVRYSSAPWDTIVPILSEVRATATATLPAGYLVPQEWTVCRDRLDVHRIPYRRFAAAWSDSVEVERVLEWRTGDLAEGHRATLVKSVAVERRLRAMRPGDLWVPLDQPASELAVHLFEAQAADGLTRWNFFDTIFEKKEYSESYVMEPIAKQMMDKDPALAREFQAKVASDPAFARDPRARNDWFYRRSPWADPQQDRLPVVRALHAPPDRVLEPTKP